MVEKNYNKPQSNNGKRQSLNFKRKGSTTTVQSTSQQSVILSLSSSLRYCVLAST